MCLFASSSFFFWLTDAKFPRQFLSEVKQIYKRLFRLYAHLYCTHSEKIRSIGANAHLNTCFSQSSQTQGCFSLSRTSLSRHCTARTHISLCFSTASTTLTLFRHRVRSTKNRADPAFSFCLLCVLFWRRGRAWIRFAHLRFCVLCAAHHLCSVMIQSISSISSVFHTIPPSYPSLLSRRGMAG